MKPKKENTSFVSKVLDFLKGGDERKIERFQGRTVKHCKTQISIRETEISDLKEKINDVEEEKKEAIVNVDLEAIATTDGVKEYIEKYTNRLFAIKAKIKRLEKEISTKTKEIQEFESIISDLK